jgi:hypothetical protein
MKAGQWAFGRGTDPALEVEATSSGRNLARDLTIRGILIIVVIVNVPTISTRKGVSTARRYAPKRPHLFNC